MGTKGTPWLTLEHGFNYVAFDGWTCAGPKGKALDYWMNPRIAMGLPPPNSAQPGPNSPPNGLTPPSGPQPGQQQGNSQPPQGPGSGMTSV